MKTIDVSVDDETYRRVRAKAEAEGATVAEFVRARLCELVETEEERFERLLRNTQEFWARLDEKGGLDSRENLSREELYDRAARRRETEEGR